MSARAGDVARRVVASPSNGCTRGKRGVCEGCLRNAIQELRGCELLLRTVVLMAMCRAIGPTLQERRQAPSPSAETQK